jgi:hypothetical protein
MSIVGHARTGRDPSLRPDDAEDAPHLYNPVSPPGSIPLYG